MMEEHQTSPTQDGGATNTIDCPTVCNKGREGEITALPEPHWHDKGHPSPALDYMTVSKNGETASCMEKTLSPISPKEHLPPVDKSTPTAPAQYTADCVEVLSEDDGIITVLIKEDPIPHDGPHAAVPSSDSATDQPSAIQPNSSEIEVIYQNPPNATFGDIANLTQYSRTHSKRKTLQCLVCGKYFLRTAHLVAHEVTHSERFTVSCSKCGQMFPSTGDLLAHKKTHRPEMLFLCLECGRCYRCRGQLVLHQRRHLREKSLAST